MEPATEQDGQLAAQLAREDILEALNTKGPSIGLVMTRLKQAISAKQTKASFDRESGTWAYSAAMVDNRIRLDAVRLALDLYGAIPSQKVDVSHSGSVKINVTRTIIDGGAKDDE